MYPEQGLPVISGCLARRRPGSKCAHNLKAKSDTSLASPVSGSGRRAGQSPARAEFRGRIAAASDPRALHGARPISRPRRREPGPGLPPPGGPGGGPVSQVLLLFGTGPASALGPNRGLSELDWRVAQIYADEGRGPHFGPGRTGRRRGEKLSENGEELSVPGVRNHAPWQRGGFMIVNAALRDIRLVHEEPAATGS